LAELCAEPQKTRLIDNLASGLPEAFPKTVRLGDLLGIAARPKLAGAPGTIRLKDLLSPVPAPAKAPAPRPAAPPPPRAVVRGCVLQAASPASEAVLHGRPLEIGQFPFRVGRQSSQSGWGENDLYLPDTQPYHVSRKHFSIEESTGGYLLVDRESTLGTVVNGVHIGMTSARTAYPLTPGVHTVVVGGPASPFKFTIKI
jgi:hypothetical protein